MGTKEECCINCGMTVAVEIPKEAPKESPVVTSKETPEPPEPKKEVPPPPPPEPPKPVKVFRTLDLVIIADDSPLVSSMAKDSFIKKSLAKEVIVCNDGADFISSFMSIIKKGISPSLVLLGVSMSRLNGLDTALVMRSMEKGGQLQPPIPIIFLTTRFADEKLEQVISQLKPADHLYKGTEPNQEQFEYMLSNVVEKLFPDRYEYIIMK